MESIGTTDYRLMMMMTTSREQQAPWVRPTENLGSIWQSKSKLVSDRPTTLAELKLTKKLLSSP